MRRSLNNVPLTGAQLETLEAVRLSMKGAGVESLASTDPLRFVVELGARGFAVVPNRNHPQHTALDGPDVIFPGDDR